MLIPALAARRAIKKRQAESPEQKDARATKRATNRAARLEIKAAKKAYKGGKKEAKARLVATKAAIKSAARTGAAPNETAAALKVLKKDPQAPRKLHTYLKHQGVNPTGMNVGQMATAAAAARAAQAAKIAAGDTNIRPMPEVTQPDGPEYYGPEAEADVYGMPTDELVEMYQEAAEEYELPFEDVAPDWLEDYEADMIADEFVQGFSENPETSNFIDPATWAAVKVIGEQGYKGVAMKRAKAGKKTLGMEYDPTTGQRKTAQAPPAPGTVGDILGKGVTAYKQRTFIDYLPVILLAAVVIWLAATMFAKR